MIDTVVDLIGSHAEPIVVPSVLTASHGDAVRQRVVGGVCIARFSDVMNAEDIIAGRLVKRLVGQLDSDSLDISAIHLPPHLRDAAIGVFLDWLGTLPE